MMTDGGDLDELRALATNLAQLRQADILIYSGPLSRPQDGQMMPGRQDQPRHATCLLVLNTLGGSAEAAYRLVRALLRRYTRLTVYVDDYCKGAGMLLALAAHELVISDFGELGPLDLHQQHPITPGHGESGLAMTQGLEALRREAEASFEQHLVHLRARRTIPLTTRAALEQASTMTVGLLSQVFSQIDPIHVAEADRALRTARLYAERLASANLREGALDRLLTGYPSHDFVIDREEALDLVRTARAPTREEAEFLTHVEPIMGHRHIQSRLLALDDAIAIVEGRSGLAGAAREAAPVRPKAPEPTNGGGMAEQAEDTRPGVAANTRTGRASG